jgi:hypothetical protein
MIERGLKRILVLLSVIVVPGLAVLSWVYPWETCEPLHPDANLCMVVPRWGLTALRFLGASAGSLILLWATFYAVRWIVQGFRREENT